MQSPVFSPRFSCDGRELSGQPMDSQGSFKSIDKHGQLSRLSLDSREGNPGISNFNSRANSLLDDSNLDQDRYRRSPSVVARLMGLDELPDTPSTPKVPDTKYDQLPYSPKSNLSDSAIHKLKYRSTSLKTTSTTEETTPLLSQEQDCITQNAEKNASVYSEIQKRLQQLELYHTNMDLRVLKQLLGTMKEKDLAKRVGINEKESEMSVKDSYSEQSEKQDQRAKRLVVSPKRVLKPNGTSKDLGSPIVIMKPAKSLDKSVASVNYLAGSRGLLKFQTSNADDGTKISNRNGYSNDQSPKFGHKELDVLVLLSTDKQYSRQYREDNLQKSPSNSVQSLYKPQESSRPKDVTGSLSPRLQQQKYEAEKKSNSSTQPKNRQLDEQSTMTSKVRPKRYVQKDDGKAYDIINEKNSLRSRENDIFRRPKNGANLALTSDAEIDSLIQKKLSFLQQYIQTPTNKNCSQTENGTKTTELANISTALHSPVSVLDASVLQDASENSPKDDLSQDLRVECQPMSLPETQLSELNTETNIENSENADTNLVQKLEMPGSADNEPQTMDFKSPDHKYVFEILSATGLLSKDKKCGLTRSNTSGLHSSRNAINPDMFYVLEQSKNDLSSMLESVQEHSTKTKLSPQKLHRRLVFDVVNEILTNRIELVTYSSLPHMLIQTRKQSGEELLQELYSEIEKLQATGIKLPGSEDDDDHDDNCTSAEDVAYQPGWDLDKERAELALGIERLILRDLINETVNGMASTV